VFFADDVSWKNMFSTHLWAANVAGLAIYIYGNGEDPLPRKLEEAIVDIGEERIEKGEYPMGPMRARETKIVRCLRELLTGQDTAHFSLAADTRNETLSSPSLHLFSTFKLLLVA
jgi:hypothetical protein